MISHYRETLFSLKMFLKRDVAKHSLYKPRSSYFDTESGLYSTPTPVNRLITADEMQSVVPCEEHWLCGGPPSQDASEGSGGH